MVIDTYTRVYAKVHLFISTDLDAKADKNLQPIFRNTQVNHKIFCCGTYIHFHSFCTNEVLIQVKTLTSHMHMMQCSGITI